MEPQTLLFDALIPSLEEVGARFERGDFFVPEMLIAGRAMAGAMELLRPLLAETGVETVGKFLMGTVKGDVHDIGKNLVNIMLEGAGFEVIDLGVQVAPEKFVAAIEEHKPDIVGFSAFLTTTMPMFKANMNALEKAGIRDHGDRHGRRCPGHPGVRRRGRRRRLRRRRLGQTVKRAKDLLHEQRAKVPAEPAPTRAPCETVLRSATQGGRARPRPAVLHHRRADQPDRPPDLPGAAARRRPVGDRARRAGPGRGRRRRARHQHGRPADRRGRAAGQGDHDWCRSSPTCRSASTPRSSRRSRRGSSVYQGRALVNSITAEDDRMAAILPLVKKYDAAVIALPNDHDEIPMEADKRLELTAEDHRRRHHGVRHRRRRHRDRPAGHADRRRHHDRRWSPWRRCAGSATSSAST